MGPEVEVLRPWPYICWALNKSHNLLIIGNMHSWRHLFQGGLLPLSARVYYPRRIKKEWSSVWCELIRLWFKPYILQGGKIQNKVLKLPRSTVGLSTNLLYSFYMHIERGSMRLDKGKKILQSWRDVQQRDSKVQ